MTDERLFAIEEVPEVPVLRAPSKAFTRGAHDERFKNDYPPEWDRCQTCMGRGRLERELEFKENLREGMEYRVGADVLTSHSVIDRARARHRVYEIAGGDVCPNCLGMGSVKAKVRYLAGHRCERCKHPYVPKGDAERLARLRGAIIGNGVAREASWREGGWSRCDEQCQHDMKNVRFYPRGASPIWNEASTLTSRQQAEITGPVTRAAVIEAAWRILTVHHLNGDKADLRWWNLAALCQRCHLYIQNNVLMERVYPLPHSEWFKPHAAGWYAWIYNGEDLSREEVDRRMDELLALELATA